VVYSRFDSNIRFKNESDGRFDSRFDSNGKKTDSQVPNLHAVNYLIQVKFELSALFTIFYNVIA